jgi:hypothetical protein
VHDITSEIIGWDQVRKAYLAGADTPRPAGYREKAMTVKETRHFTWIEDPQSQTWQTTVERDGFTVKVVMQVDELNDPGNNDVFALMATASRADIELGFTSLGIGQLSGNQGPGPDEYADELIDKELIPEAIDRAQKALARLTP